MARQVIAFITGAYRFRVDRVSIAESLKHIIILPISKLRHFDARMFSPMLTSRYLY